MALEHLLHTTERDRCVQLVTALVLPTYQAGQMSTVQRWLTALGDAAIEAYPPLAVLAGWIAVLTGQTAEAQRWAAIVDAAVVRRGAGGRHSVVRLGAGDAARRDVCRRSGADDGRRQLRGRPGAAVEPMARPGALPVGEAHLLTGDVDQAAVLFAEASAVAATMANTDVLVLSESELAPLAMDRGRWAEAAEHLDSRSPPSMSIGCTTTPRACSPSPGRPAGGAPRRPEGGQPPAHLGDAGPSDLHVRAALSRRAGAVAARQGVLGARRPRDSPSPAQRDRRHPARPACPRRPRRRGLGVPRDDHRARSRSGRRRRP